jgi:RecB family exonuclease
VTGASPRRAAIEAALAEHLDARCLSLAADASFVDGFFALALAAERAIVDDAALAIAAAEADDATAMLARILLSARRHASLVAANDSGAVAASADERAAGARVRALLEAASADDEEAVVRWLASPSIGLDIGQIRTAQAATQPASLRSTLAQALNSFRGQANRDRAMRAARALRAVTVSLDAASADLTTIVRAATRAVDAIDPAYDQQGATAEIDAMTCAAEDADLVWAGAARLPHVRHRVRSLLEALSRSGAARAAWPIAQPSFMAVRDWSVQQSLRTASDAPGFDKDDASASGFGADPWDWPAPEPPRAIVAPPMTFSASRLNSFVTCGRRWFFEYLCDAVEDRGSIHATYGKVVHQALEALHREVREPAAVHPRAIVDRFLREIDVAFGKARPDFASQFEYEVARLQARRAAPRYVDWLVKSAVLAPMEIVEVESVNRLRAGGHDFVGYIDRVDRPLGGGALTIFDYKTGRVPDDPRAYLEAVRTGDEAQLALYYFMRRARGDDVARVALVSIRDIHDDVRVLALDIVEDGADVPPFRSGTAACTRAVLDASLAALVRRCDLLTKEGLAHFAVGDDPPCRFCAYLTACRERPPEPESIFVR